MLPRRAVVAAEPLTIHVVVIVLTVVWDVKRLVIILNGLELLIVLGLVVHHQAVSFIACIRYSSWVCAIRSQVAQFADNTLRTYIDVLGVLATLTSHQVWADIEREACRTRVTPREFGVDKYSFVLTAGLHCALAVGVIPMRE